MLKGPGLNRESPFLLVELERSHSAVAGKNMSYGLASTAMSSLVTSTVT